jgi:hypothetical protein
VPKTKAPVEEGAASCKSLHHRFGGQDGKEEEEGGGQLSLTFLEMDEDIYRLAGKAYD